MADLRSKVDTFYERFAAGDFDAAAAVFHDDVVSEEPALGRTASLAEWRAYGEAFKRACPDAHMVVRDSLEEGDLVAVEAAFVGTFTAPLESRQGTVPPTGQAFELGFADFFRFRGDRVAEHRVYYDQVDFMAQLGISPPPAG